MSSPGQVGGVGNQPQYMTNYDKATLEILDRATNLRTEANEHYKAASGKLGDAGREFVDGFGHLGLAVANGLVGVPVRTVQGTWFGLEAGGNALYGVGLAGAGAAAEITENSRGWIATQLNNFAAYLTGRAEANSNKVGDGQQQLFWQTDAKNMLGLSDKLYAEASVQFGEAGDDIKASGQYYLWAFAHGAAVFGESWDGAKHLAASGADVLKSGAELGKGWGDDIAGTWVQFTALMVQADENMVQLSADAQVSLARLVSSAADLIATANDPESSVDISHDMKAIDLSFRELLNATPELKALPAAKAFLAMQPAN